MHEFANEGIDLQDRWIDLECVNVHDGNKYRMVDCKEIDNIPKNAVFPSQFARLLIDYQEHPEAKSLGPDGNPCESDTRGLLKRTHVIAGEIRYVGKETDRKWEEGDEISLLDFKTTEYGRSKRVIASEEIKKKILQIGINKCARESGFHRANFIRKLVRGLPVKRNSYSEFVRWVASASRVFECNRSFVAKSTTCIHSRVRTENYSAYLCSVIGSA